MIKYRLSGKEVRFCCPFCEEVAGKSPDTKFHLYVSMETGDWICFRCGAKGRGFKGLPDEMVLVVVQEALKQGIQHNFTSQTIEASSLLPDDLVEIHSLSKSNFPPVKYILHRLMLHLRIWDRESLLRHIPYGYIYVSPSKNDRVFFFSRTLLGEADYYVIRLISEKRKSSRYVYPEGLKRPLLKIGLWGQKEISFLFIVEGIVDALVTYMRYGVPVIALGGKTLSDKHLNELNTFPLKKVSVLVFLDKDAQRDSCLVLKKLYSSLRNLGSLYRLVPLRNDPADSGGEFEEVYDYETDTFCLSKSLLNK